MATNRRTIRRPRIRVDDPQKWRMLFRSGFDYLGDLGDRSLRYDANWMADQARAEIVREAWSRLGQHFTAQSAPWAFAQFGEPG